MASALAHSPSTSQQLIEDRADHTAAVAGTPAAVVVSVPLVVAFLKFSTAQLSQVLYKASQAKSSLRPRHVSCAASWRRRAWSGARCARSCSSSWPSATPRRTCSSSTLSSRPSPLFVGLSDNAVLKTALMKALVRVSDLDSAWSLYNSLPLAKRDAVCVGTMSKIFVDHAQCAAKGNDEAWLLSMFNTTESNKAILKSQRLHGRQDGVERLVMCGEAFCIYVICAAI